MVMVKTINDADFDSGIENINVNSTVEIIFSHTLNTDLFSSSLTLNSDTGTVDYSLVFSNTNSTVTLIPSIPLNYETNYTLTLPAGDYATTNEISISVN